MAVFTRVTDTQDIHISKIRDNLFKVSINGAEVLAVGERGLFSRSEIPALFQSRLGITITLPSRETWCQFVNDELDRLEKERDHDKN